MNGSSSSTSNLLDSKSKTFHFVTRSRYTEDRIDFNYDLCSQKWIKKIIFLRRINCLEIGLIHGKTNHGLASVLPNTNGKVNRSIVDSVQPYIGKHDRRSTVEFVKECDRKIMVFLEVDSHKISAFLQLLKGSALYWAEHFSKRKRYRNVRDNFIDEFYDKDNQNKERDRLIVTDFPQFKGQLLSELVSSWLNKTEFSIYGHWDSNLNIYDILFHKMPIDNSLTFMMQDRESHYRVALKIIN